MQLVCGKWSPSATYMVIFLSYLIFRVCAKEEAKIFQKKLADQKMATTGYAYHHHSTSVSPSAYSTKVHHKDIDEGIHVGHIMHDIAEDGNSVISDDHGDDTFHDHDGGADHSDDTGHSMATEYKFSVIHEVGHGVTGGDKSAGYVAGYNSDDGINKKEIHSVSDNYDNIKETIGHYIAPVISNVDSGEEYYSKLNKEILDKPSVKPIKTDDNGIPICTSGFSSNYEKIDGRNKNVGKNEQVLNSLIKTVDLDQLGDLNSENEVKEDNTSGDVIYDAKNPVHETDIVLGHYSGDNEYNNGKIIAENDRQDKIKEDYKSYGNYYGDYGNFYYHDDDNKYDYGGYDNDYGSYGDYGKYDHDADFKGHLGDERIKSGENSGRHGYGNEGRYGGGHGGQEGGGGGSGGHHGGYNNYHHIGDYFSYGLKDEKRNKGSRSLDEGLLNHYDKGGFESISKENGDSEKNYHDEASLHGYHDEFEKGEKGDHFDEKAGHKNGTESKGYHHVLHKDEYTKEHKFYDNAHKGGYFSKGGHFGGHHQSSEGDYAKGDHHDSAHDSDHFGKKEYNKKGHHYSDRDGRDYTDGFKTFYHHDTDYGEKDGSSHGKEYNFKDIHKGDYFIDYGDYYR